MTSRVTTLGLFAALLTWVGIGLPGYAQHKQTSHGKNHGSAHDETVKRMKRMSPEERRKFHEQMMKEHGMGGMRHGHDKPLSGKPNSAKPIAIGDRVPDFTVRDLQGKARSLSELQKQTKYRIVSLTFWCTFCHSCRDMESRLDRFASEHKGRAAVAAIDASAGETASGIAAFAKKTGLSLPILIDAPGKAADLFGVTLTTTTLVIDGQGRLRYRGQFMVGEKMLAADVLKAVLAGKPVATKETRQRG